VGLLDDLDPLGLELSNDLCQQRVILEASGPAEDPERPAIEPPALEEDLFADAADDDQLTDALMLEGGNDLVPLPRSKAIETLYERVEP
jgi:hypothetical protein